MVSVTDTLRLGDDVALVPVGDLPEDLRQEFRANAGTVAIMRLRTPIPLRMITANAARFIDLFRSPRTVIEVVLRYSLRNKRDPQEVLKEFSPVVRHMVEEHLLVPAELSEAACIDATFCRGDDIDGNRISDCMEALEAYEVYQARNPMGDLVALKVLGENAGPRDAARLENEARILDDLEGNLAPRLLARGCYRERPYLCLTWCSGVSVLSAAAELRAQGPKAASGALLELCIAVLASYAGLHAQQVVHGNVQPQSPLVDARGAVKLIDFGWAQRIDPQAETGKPASPSFASEQFALAALIHHLLTGRHYVGLARVGAHGQERASAAPPPFEEQGIAPWPGVEEVLARALSTDPGQRFPSVAIFASHLRTAGRVSTIARTLRAAAAAQRHKASAASRKRPAEALQRLR